MHVALHEKSPALVHEYVYESIRLIETAAKRIYIHSIGNNLNLQKLTRNKPGIPASWSQLGPIPQTKPIVASIKSHD